MPRVKHRDPFNASLLVSPPLDVTDEQKAYLWEICQISSSDSKFAQKAYEAILHVLTAGVAEAPVITSLTPATAAIGDAAFTLSVIGTGFTPTSVISFNGLDEPTTFVSPTEVSTGVDMSVWLAEAVVPVTVTNGDVVSDPMDFTFTAPAVLSTGSKTPVKDAHVAGVKTLDESKFKDKK